MSSALSRLHHIVTSGRITSNRGGGEYGLTRFDDSWQCVVEKRLRIRCDASRRSLYRSPFERRTQALEFIDMAIHNAQQKADRA